MAARSKKRRDKNNRLRRNKNKAKELKKLKKTLGLLDEDGMELMETVKDITEQKTEQDLHAKFKQEIKQEILERETQDTIDHNTYVEVVHPTSSVKHKYNTKTKRDQFGQFPVWYNTRREKRKKKMLDGNVTNHRGNRGRKIHFIDQTCNWRGVV